VEVIKEKFEKGGKPETRFQKKKYKTALKGLL
jgi:hypothetical protein